MVFVLESMYVSIGSTAALQLQSRCSELSTTAAENKSLEDSSQPDSLEQ